MPRVMLPRVEHGATLDELWGHGGIERARVCDRLTVNGLPDNLLNRSESQLRSGLVWPGEHSALVIRVSTIMTRQLSKTEDSSQPVRWLLPTRSLKRLVLNRFPC